MSFDVNDLSVTEGQRSFAAFIKRETGKAVKPEVISLIEAMREPYRKDPERVAERERVAVAARERKQALLAKKVEQARRLAASLGVEILVKDGVTVDLSDEPVGEPVTIADEPEPEPESEPLPAPRRRRARGTAAAAQKPVLHSVPDYGPDVDPLEATPADDVALSEDIDVMEATDGWQEMEPAADSDNGEVEDW